MCLDAGCDITKNCHADGQCHYDYDIRNYRCKCNEGYQGDGKICEKLVIGCNFLNNCHKYAICEFNDMEGGFRCLCDTSRVSILHLIEYKSIAP